MKKSTKKKIYMTGIIIFGLVTSVIIFVMGEYDGKLKEGLFLERNEWGKGDSNVLLTAGIGEFEKKVNIPVAEREFNEEEVRTLYESISKELVGVILNGNSSLKEVSDDLFLPSSLKEYPFRLKWVTEDENIVDNRGRILRNRKDENEYEMNISCVISYKDFKEITSFPIRVVPKKYSSREEMSLLLDEEITREDEKSSKEHYFRLPSRIEGEAVVWKEQKDMTPIWVFSGSIVAAFILSWALDYDQKQKEKKEEELLLELYPNFVEKLRMYMMAGLSSRNAFFEIYENIKNSDDPSSVRMKKVLLKVTSKFTNQVGEEKIYEEFGNECRGPYKKLSYILGVNLKQGNDMILKLLEEESVKALSMKRETAKRKGDEAGVKILFPMILMLMVVMVLIIVPAYISLG